MAKYRFLIRRRWVVVCREWRTMTRTLNDDCHIDWNQIKMYDKSNQCALTARNGSVRAIRLQSRSESSAMYNIYMATYPFLSNILPNSICSSHIYIYRNEFHLLFKQVETCIFLRSAPQCAQMSCYGVYKIITLHNIYFCDTTDQQIARHSILFGYVSNGSLQLDQLICCTYCSQAYIFYNSL